MGAPPHGGFAMGIDRFVARLAREPDIRQMNAFPKVSSGSDPLTGAPTPYPDAALKELGIRLVETFRSPSSPRYSPPCSAPCAESGTHVDPTLREGSRRPAEALPNVGTAPTWETRIT